MVFIELKADQNYNKFDKINTIQGPQNVHKKINLHFWRL